MKKETAANKLAAILGLSTNTLPHNLKTEQQKKEAKSKVTHDVAINEAEIQSFRAAQGIIYFLQAPQLFSSRTCKHCGEQFLVSRKFIGYCSYTCIRKSLEELGITWRKGEDLEALADDPQVYDGNEPIWIRNIKQLREALEHLDEIAAEHELSVR